jgi:glutamate decarboxylase
MGFLSSVPSDERASAHSVGHEQYVSVRIPQSFFFPTLPHATSQTTVYGSALSSCEMPRYELAEDEMPARTAARYVLAIMIVLPILLHVHKYL